MSDSFFTEFLKISDFRTVIFLLILGLCFVGLFIAKQRKVVFTKLLFCALLLGFIVGGIIQGFANFPDKPLEIAWIEEVVNWYSFFGNGFMDLLQMLVVPIIFISIIKIIIEIKDSVLLTKTATRSLIIMLCTTVIAAIVGIISALLFDLGKNITEVQAASQIRKITPITTVLRNLLPTNPIEAMASANIVAVIIFAGFIGMAIRYNSQKNKELMNIIENIVMGLHKIIISVAFSIIKLMPYAVVALLATNIAERGIKSIYLVFDFTIALYLAVIITFILHLVLITIMKLSPKRYVSNGIVPLVMAFASRSSIATLPVTIDTLRKRFGVDDGVASFVGSLGSNSGMNGCAGIFPAMMAITLANMTNTTMDFSFFMMLLLVIAMSSIGIAGLPGAATMAVSMVISGIGMGDNFVLLGAIIAIDPILDMGRTMLNVNGTMISAVTVSKSLNCLNEKIYNGKR